MSIFVSAVRHNCDQKTATENKIQTNVRQYKIGKYSCDIIKYNFWICGVLQVFPKINFQNAPLIPIQRYFCRIVFFAAVLDRWQSTDKFCHFRFFITPIFH
jgi:hypothetical protein